MGEEGSSGNVELRAEHRHALREHAIELLILGHGRLHAKSLHVAEEEEITGRLKEAIEYVIEAATEAPDWADRYTVYDEEKPSGSKSLGKKRPRIDITIKRRWRLRETHPRFRFEAKRLTSGNRVSHYFGKDGIGCFLRGVYPLTHPEAGMIGYVQTDTTKQWRERLAEYAIHNRARLRISPGGDWKEYKCALSNSSITQHRHPSYPALTVVHLLLLFR